MVDEWVRHWTVADKWVMQSGVNSVKGTINGTRYWFNYAWFLLSIFGAPSVCLMYETDSNATHVTDMYV